MTLRRIFLGFLLVTAFALWSWGRLATKEAHAQTTTADPVYEADGDAVGTGTNHEDASYRFRSNQSMHWRQVTLGSRGTCP